MPELLAIGQYTIIDVSDGIQGIPGVDAVAIALTNDSHVIPTDSDGNNGNYTGASTELEIYIGIFDDTDNWAISVQDTGGVTGNLAGHTYTVSNLAVDTAVITFTATQDGFPTLTKAYTVTKSKQGVSATTYDIETSATSILRDVVQNIYIPDPISISATKQLAGGTKESFSGFYYIYEQVRDAVTMDEYQTLLANALTVIDQEYIISYAPYPYVLRYSSAIAENSLDYAVVANSMGMKIELYETSDRETLLDMQTIPIIKNGENPISGYLTNESITLFATKDGVVSDFTKANGNFKVSFGNDDVTDTSAYAISSMVGCVATINATTGAYAIQSISADNATVSFTAIYRDVTLVKTVSLTKVKVGQTGANAYGVSLTATSGMQFKFNEVGTSTGIASTVLTPVYTNFTPTSYVWRKDGTVIGGATASTYTVTSAMMSAVNSSVFSCETTGTANGGTVVITDTITIIKTVDGKSTVSGYLTNESVTLSATKEGTVGDYAPASGTFKVFFGSTDVTTSSTFTISTSTDYTATVGGTTGIYSVSAMLIDNVSITLTATYSGKTVTKVLTVAKTKVGLTGDNAYSIDILPSNGLQFKFSKTGTSTGISSTNLVMNLTNITTPTYVWNKNGSAAGNTTNTLTVNSADLASVNSITYSCTVSGFANGDPITLTDTVTVTKTVDGADSHGMNLLPSNGTQFNIDSTGANIGIASTILTATPINITTPTYIWYKDGSAVGNTTNTLTVNFSDMALVTSAVYACKINGFVNGGAVSITDTLTVTKTKNGANSYNMTIDPSNGLVFKFDSSNASVGISSTVLTATPINMTSVTYVWNKDGAAAGNTTSTLTVNSSDLSSANSIKYTCIATGYVNGSQVVVTDSVTVVKTRDGSSALSIVMSNESASVPTDQNGSNGVYTSTGSAVYLYEGNSLLTYDNVGTTTGTWKIVVTTATGITAGSITDSGTFVTIGNASNITADTASILYTLTGKRLDGTAFTVTKLQTFSRMKTGTAAKSITLYGPQSFSYDEYGTLISSPSVTISVSKSNITATTYTWTYGLNGAAPTLALSPVVGQVVFGTDSVEIFESAAIWGTAKLITIKAILDGVSNSFSISKTKDGSSGITLNVETPDGNTFQGSVGGPKAVNVQLIRGSEDITSSSVIKWFFNGVQNVGMTGLSTLEVNPADVPGSLNIRIVATYNEVDYTNSIVFLDLADTYQVNIVGEDKIKNGQGSVTLTAKVFRGSTEITEGYRLRWSNIGSGTPVILLEGSDSITDRALSLTLFPADISGKIDILCELSVDTVETSLNNTEEVYVPSYDSKNYSTAMSIALN